MKLLIGIAALLMLSQATFAVESEEIKTEEIERSGCSRHCNCSPCLCINCSCHLRSVPSDADVEEVTKELGHDEQESA